MTLIPFIWAAGGVQVRIASANLPAARMFRYREHLRAVPAHVAEVFVVQNVFIVLTVLGTAGLCFAFAPDWPGAPIWAGRSAAYWPCSGPSAWPPNWPTTTGPCGGSTGRSTRCSCRRSRT